MCQSLRDGIGRPGGKSSGDQPRSDESGADRSIYWVLTTTIPITKGRQMLMSAFERLPSFDELPIKPEYPRHSAWGVFGDDDQIGTLNLLTPERVAAAAQLVKTGQV